MDLGALVAEHAVSDAIKYSNEEGDAIARLVNFVVLEGLNHKLNAVLSAEKFLVVSLLLADAGEDVQGKLSQLEAAILLFGDDANQGLDELGELGLELFEFAD